MPKTADQQGRRHLFLPPVSRATVICLPPLAKIRIFNLRFTQPTATSSKAVLGKAAKRYMQKTQATQGRPTIIMKRLLNIALLLIFFSCDNETQKSNAVWDKHKVDFKKVVELIKADKLNVVYGRTGYAIPDSIDLKTICGQLAFRMYEFEHDTSYTICFNLDTTKQIRTSPEIIYTENKKRVEDYQSRMTRVIKLDKNWFYSPSGL